MASLHTDSARFSRRAFFRLRAPDAPRIPDLMQNCLETQGVACRSCASACAAEAIVFHPAGAGRAALTIDPGKCDGCGACLSPCPVGALRFAPRRAAP